MAEPIDVGRTLHEAGRLADAEKVYGQIIAANPADKLARNNLVVLYRQQRRWREEADVLAQLADLDPAWRLELETSLLRSGRYAEGWPLYDAHPRANRPTVDYPRWAGEDVRSLLIWPEQGLGDMIMFARFIPLLVARGVEVTVLALPALERLFAPLGARVVRAEGALQLPRHDAWTYFGSLPRWLGATVENLPPPMSVRASPRGLGGVGVVTRGNPRQINDGNRSLPPNLAAEALSLPGAICLHPEVTGARDLQDTAEIVAGLDLVVSVCTSVAHLAGSMGKPTWIMLPAKNPDWRWMRERIDSPWYPSVRLFRHRPPGDWPKVLADVRAELAAAYPTSPAPASR